MAIPADRFNPDQSLKAYTAPEIAAMNIRTRGIRDGSSPTRMYSPNTSSFTATYFVDPTKHEAFKCLALGAVTVYFDAGLGSDQLSRLMPLIFPGTDKTICTQAKSKGFKFTADDTSGRVRVPGYWAEEWELTFEVPRFDLHDDPPTSERLRYVETMPREVVSEYLSLPGTGLNFLTPLGGDPHGQAIPYNVGLPMVSGRVKFKWWRIPRIAWQPGSTLWNRVFGDPDGGDIPYVGTVNSNTGYVGQGSNGYPIGTLLLEGVEEELTFDPVAEDFAYNLVWVSKHVPNGVNYLYFPGLQGGADRGWYLAGKGNTHYTSDLLPDGVAMYNTRDHRELFQVG